ncbi:MAG: DnaB-like helicase C-terminal domain-containing protein [Planctomycetota bacterium]
MKENKDVIAYIKKKGWKYNDKRDINNYYIEKCPFCGDTKFHFHINRVTGQYNCWKCPDDGEQTGNLWKLKKNLGDIVDVAKIDTAKPKKTKAEIEDLSLRVRQYHKKLRGHKRAQRIIREKYGFGMKEIETFRLGLRINDGKPWLVIPYFEAGQLTNVKYRTLPPAEKTFRREKGMKSSLYNADKADLESNTCYIVEGETDTISLHSLGFKNVFGNTVGARGVKPEWLDFLTQFETVYLIYDPDAPGQLGAKKMAYRVGINRCYNVKLAQEETDEEDLKDADLTNWVKAGNTYDDMLALLDKAELFDVDDVRPIRSVLKELEDELINAPTLESSGIITPWPPLNRCMGDFQPGDLIVMSGQAKIGKTTLALNIGIDQAKQYVPVLNYCLEMRPARTIQKVVSNLRMVDRKEISQEDLQFVQARYGNIPFYVAHSYRFTVEQVFETIREAVNRYGIELVIFDHLHFLVRSLTHITEEIGNVVRDFKLLAEELRVPIILICQPRKVQGKNARMTYDDLRDAASIGQDADTVVIVHRDRLPAEDPDDRGEENPIFSNVAEIIVDATRYNPGGSTKLHFNGAFSRYFLDEKDERATYTRET